MLWSIDTCQNKVPADRYYVTILRTQVVTYFFFEVDRWPTASFRLDRGLMSAKLAEITAGIFGSRLTLTQD